MRSSFAVRAQFGLVFLGLSAPLVGALAPNASAQLQGISPTSEQPGVNFDGSAAAACNSSILSVARNPTENVAPGVTQVGVINLAFGGLSETYRDVFLPAEIPIPIAISFNGRQEDVSQDHVDSSGWQGWNWFQNSQMEIVHKELLDQVWLYLAADRFVKYQLVDGTSDLFTGLDGAGGFFKLTPTAGDEPELWVFTDMTGLQVTFIGFDGSPSDAAGQWWKIERPASGATAYVGADASARDAIEADGWSVGRIQTAFDSAGRQFSYTYSGSPERLTSVVVAKGEDECARVDYTYYDGVAQTSFGLAGDLRTATVTTPIGDADVDLVQTRYFRYYVGGYDATDNKGHDHALKLVLDHEGVRRFDWQNSNFDGDHLTATTNELKPYAQVFLEYDSDHRVSLAQFNGQCGCSGGASGVHEFSYANNGSFSPINEYDTEWHRRVVVLRPDGSYLTQYFDEKAQALSSVVSDGAPSGSPTFWPTQVIRDSNGYVTEVWTPDAILSYTHSTGAFAPDTSGGGLVRLYTRVSTGPAIGYLSERRWANATDYDDPDWDAAYLDAEYSWNTTDAKVTVGSTDVIVPLLASVRTYWDDLIEVSPTGSHLTTFDYSVYASQKFAVKKITETQPTVTTGKHGSGDTHQVFKQLRPDGQLEYRAENTLEDAGRKVVQRRSYTPEAQLQGVYEDADTSGIGGLDAAFVSEGDEFNDSESYTYDCQGRVRTHLDHGGRTRYFYYSRLEDQRIVRLIFPHYTTDSGGTFHTPASYEVANHASKTEFVAVIADSSPFTVGAVALDDFIDEDDDDPITATGFSELKRVVTTQYDGSGARAEGVRTYFLTPASGAGTDGTNYDATTFAHDGLGRIIRTKEPHLTIHRTVYDARGLPTQRWIGTNDYSMAAGEASGPIDMVQTHATGYNSNGWVTTQTEYTEATTGSGARTTTYHLDLRGRAIATVRPTVPHSVREFDNLGRVIKSAEYGSSSGLDNESLVTDVANRLALSESEYDERGRVFRSARHNIDPSDGSDDDSLETLTWYDEVGRAIKVDGERLVKYRYDRIGQRTHEFVLASDDDANFEDVADIGNDPGDELLGDIVLEEHQAAYDSKHQVWLNVAISRLYTGVGASPDDGPLDNNTNNSNPDALTAADVVGRAQITAYWFDVLGRETDRAEYGTNHASLNVDDFDRDAIGNTVPTRSADVLVTSTAYAKDGAVESVLDPMGRSTKFEYDDAGRTTAEIANYVNGTPGGGAAGDEDQVVRYAYVDGLMVTLTSDLPGAEPDQVTTYTYGTVKGTSPGQSTIAAGHLLAKVQYPDSTDATNDIVAFAYNSQGEEVWRRDQADPLSSSDYNIIVTDYDASGRATARRVTQKRSITDGSVRRIATAYDSLGRTDTVTQYDDATSGNVVDQVKYLYDGWGNLTNFRQDKDSVVGGSGYWDVAYAYAKATGGRNTLRRTQVTLPGGGVFKFYYRTGTSSHDDKASRVTTVRDATDADLAGYLYNGVGHVVRTELSDVGIFSKAYNGSGTTFGRLDRFDRTLISSWTRDLSPDRDIYNVTLGYDRNSNVTFQDDAVHTGHDVRYTNDGLNRLLRAREGENWSGSAFANEERDQQWILSQTGNWNFDKLDLDGDGLYTSTGELNDERLHNAANELEARDIDNDSTDDYLPLYDPAGNMVDDDEHYKYEWDAFYRLRRVKNQSDALVSEYWYNGLGYLVTRHQDTTGNGIVGGSDLKFHTAYDERWRPVATFRDTDTAPKETFVYHCAGNGGYGGSSYIDSVLLRDRDMANGWTGAAVGTLDERIYYMQNWRADVVALVAPNGAGGANMVEWVKYSAYGVPFGLPAGDSNSDGNCDGADDTQVTAWVDGAMYDVRGDLDLDGDVDVDDETNVALIHQNLGRTALSSLDIGNRKGYAGYEADAKLRGSKWHVRHRVLDSVLGRWLRRDPLGYAIDRNVLQYCFASPISWTDADGREPQDLNVSAAEPGEQAARGGQALADGIEAAINRQLEKRLNPKERELYDNGEVGLGDLWRAKEALGETVRDLRRKLRRTPVDGASENAWMHCVVACKVARKMGRDKAKKLLDAHEFGTVGEDPRPAAGSHRLMDLINNDAGFECAESVSMFSFWGCNSSCEACCDCKFTSGGLVWIHEPHFYVHIGPQIDDKAECHGGYPGKWGPAPGEDGLPLVRWQGDQH